MAKGTRGRRRIASRQYRSTPYPLPNSKKSPKIKKDWEDATCSVCMEYPHNAVLLLCSSHDKGCRPYMCGTSSRYSNCLEQYKKAYTKVSLFEKTELACPLCRGQVKGWTVVDPARDYLNAKKRSCMDEKCSFVGTYKELRKHVKTEHPCAKPHEVDPVLEQKWRRLEHEREREDVISTIRSSMPGAVVFGDYVIEGSHYGLDDLDSDDEDELERESDADLRRNVVVLFQRLGAYESNRWNNRDPRQNPEGFVLSDLETDSESDDDIGGSRRGRD